MNTCPPAGLCFFLRLIRNVSGNDLSDKGGMLSSGYFPVCLLKFLSGLFLSWSLRRRIRSQPHSDSTFLPAGSCHPAVLLFQAAAAVCIFFVYVLVSASFSEAFAGGSGEERTDNAARSRVPMGVTDPGGYWGRKAEGWFFYADPGSGDHSDGKQPEHPEEIPLTTAWLRVNLPKYLDLAIDNPTSENVRAYLYLQRLALDRAQRFSEAVKEEVAGNYFLDEISRRPVASFGAAVFDQISLRARESLMKKLGDRLSLIYVFDSGDAATVSFSKLVGSVRDDYGIYVRAARTGQETDESGYFSDAVPGAQLLQSLGIAVLPAVFIYSEGTGLVPLVQGYLSHRELVDRIILLSHREGIISDEEYESTLPFRRRPPFQTGIVFFSAHRVGSLVQPGDLVKYFEGQYETEKNFSSAADGGR